MSHTHRHTYAYTHKWKCRHLQLFIISLIRILLYREINGKFYCTERLMGIFVMDGICAYVCACTCLCMCV